jgi:hypothetical protein
MALGIHLLSHTADIQPLKVIVQRRSFALTWPKKKMLRWNPSRVYGAGLAGSPII